MPISETELNELLDALENCAREMHVARHTTPPVTPETLQSLIEKHGTKGSDIYQTMAEADATALVTKYRGQATQ